MEIPDPEESSNSDDIGKFVSELCSENHVFSKDDSLFYFETDFLPLKGNTDYSKLMKTLAILEAQRAKAFQDINELQELKLKSVEDPEMVKEQILARRLSCLSRCKIEKVPEIDFSKYRSLNTQNRKHFPMRRKVTRQQATPKEDEGSPSSSEVKVRGRVYTEKKPRTFNQLWTVEEQLRLEQLLAEIPPEPVEYRRWEKIAEALGSRTAQQVCSRVQKYFKKLQKAGISAPTLKRSSTKKRAYYVYKQNKHFLYRPSTFFPGASMGELEETDSDDSSSSLTTPDLTHWKEIHRKLNEEKDNEELKVEHIGFKCGKCQKNPIVGLRWECESCTGISFCSECMSQMFNLTPPPHPLTHHFKYIDLFDNRSYRTEVFACDNYLDPNAHLT